MSAFNKVKSYPYPNLVYVLLRQSPGHVRACLGGCQGFGSFWVWFGLLLVSASAGSRRCCCSLFFFGAVLTLFPCEQVSMGLLNLRKVSYSVHCMTAE